ncbi:MAG: hydantoinase B/oxoprolinase family protein, partial [Caldilineales bacterium]|nr:hydantoinase B/oxoprolinase family protein [Caldilineales bacterium]
GRWRGGDGLVREIELLADAQVTILSERRRHAPWGAAGGEPAAAGANRHIPAGGEPILLPGKVTLRARTGDRIRIETPGGGGYGEAPPPAVEPLVTGNS